ncbi:hypothetical protein SLH49_14610 [Cognatiyoonia sp. IB215446]|uniref:hypothetical protein n=1 Tax=Cognatiyoonia sp. IB215446 TaxID=3097355 RepID=UPI002A1768AF|nr:hypothetical protein [Cognatiyoonia sp. IB215446]MDX8349215.1 hypothetical protein [Cognatiyoonia sp. IB215446]
MKKFTFLVLASSLCPGLPAAQEAEPGGVFFTFDITQSLEANSDRDLATPEEEDEVEATLGLRFGAVTETRTQRLAFGLGTGLRAVDGEVSNEDVSVQLSYDRNSADAVLNTSVRAVRSDISFLRDASDFINDQGEIELPDDFEDLTGTGTRTASTISAGFRWGETAPLGYRISVSQQFLRYEDASAALADSDTGSIGAGLRLNINEVTTGNLDLSYTQTDEVGEPLEDRVTLSGSVTVDRPLGDLTFQLSTSRDEADDIFWAGSVARRLALPRSALSGSLGLVEDEAGEARPTGSLAYTLPRPAARIELSANRSLPPGGDRATTTLRGTYAQEITPVSNMLFDVTFGETRDPDGSDRLATGSVTGRYAVELTPVWSFSVGAGISLRDEDGTRRRSNSLFLGLDRPISWRP